MNTAARTMSCAGSIDTAGGSLSIAIEASDGMPGVSSIVNSSIAFFDSAIAAFALSASAPTVNRIFALRVVQLKRQLLRRADRVRGVHDRAELARRRRTRPATPARSATTTTRRRPS